VVYQTATFAPIFRLGVWIDDVVEAETGASDCALHTATAGDWPWYASYCQNIPYHQQAAASRFGGAAAPLAWLRGDL